MKQFQTIKSQTGLTLIEVLIALAILSIALITISKVTSQSILRTQYVENKMIAAWIANGVVNHVKAGLVKLPNAPEHLEKKTSTLGKEWYWHANISNTPNKNIRKINVDIFSGTSSNRLIHFESYLYVQSSPQNDAQ